MMYIADFLETGEKNTKTSKELCKLLNLDNRTLQAAIERERKCGSPICANYSIDNHGYFLAGTKKEMMDYCSRLQRKVGSISDTLEACRKTIDHLPE